jgi:hypothetical protein
VRVIYITTEWLRKDGTIPDLSSNINVIKSSFINPETNLDYLKAHLEAPSWLLVAATHER